LQALSILIDEQQSNLNNIINNVGNSIENFSDAGKGKGEGIPLLVYGKDGKKKVGWWWKSWKAGMSVANEGFPAKLF
jgi:hypothetical protein